MIEADRMSTEGQRSISPSCALYVCLFVIAILVASSACAVLGTNLLAIRRLLDHYLLLCLIGGIAVTVLLFFITSRRLKLTIFVLYLLTAIFLVAFSYLFQFRPMERQTLPAPDGRPFQLIISEATAVIDPVDILSIRQRDGLIRMEWDFACLNGDDPANSLKSVEWSSTNQLRVVLGDGHSQKIAVDQITGEPRSHIARGQGC